MLMQNVPLQIPSLKPFKGPCHSGTFLGIQLRGSFRLSERLKCQKTCLKDPFLRRLQAWLHNFQLLLGKSWWNEMDPFWGMGILSGPQRGKSKAISIWSSHYESLWVSSVNQIRCHHHHHHQEDPSTRVECWVCSLSRPIPMIINLTPEKFIATADTCGGLLSGMG